MVMDAIEKLARELHDIYNRHMKFVGVRSMMRNWNSLPHNLKEAEKAKARYILMDLGVAEKLGEKIVNVCRDCGVKVGEVHEYGCPQEACPFCAGFMERCGCAREHLGIDSSYPDWKRVAEAGLNAEEVDNWMIALRKKGRVPYSKEQIYRRKMWDKGKYEAMYGKDASLPEETKPETKEQVDEQGNENTESDREKAAAPTGAQE